MIFVKYSTGNSYLVMCEQEKLLRELVKVLKGAPKVGCAGLAEY